MLPHPNVELVNYEVGVVQLSTNIKTTACHEKRPGKLYKPRIIHAFNVMQAHRIFLCIMRLLWALGPKARRTNVRPRFPRPKIAGTTRCSHTLEQCVHLHASCCTCTFEAPSLCPLAACSAAPWLNYILSQVSYLLQKYGHHNTHAKDHFYRVLVATSTA